MEVHSILPSEKRMMMACKGRWWKRSRSGGSWRSTLGPIKALPMVLAWKIIICDSWGRCPIYIGHNPYLYLVEQSFGKITEIILLKSGNGNLSLNGLKIWMKSSFGFYCKLELLAHYQLLYWLIRGNYIGIIRRLILWQIHSVLINWTPGLLSIDWIILPPINEVYLLPRNLNSH